MIKYILLFLILCSSLVSCHKNTSSNNVEVENRNALNDKYGIPSDVKYAVGFDMWQHEDYAEVVVYNPWVVDAIQQRYYLVRNNNIKIPQNGIRLKIPIESIAISSCTHTEFLDMIGCVENVIAMCSPNLIYNEVLYQRYINSKIRSIGDAFNVDFEGLLLASPTIYMVSSYNNQNDNMERIAKAGVNVVYNNEWTETTLLGRAEWVKFMAAFFDKSALADSLFAAIEHSYQQAIEVGRQATDKPSVMAGGNFKGTWYVPGGNAWMGRLFVDAGGEYYYSTIDSSTTSIPLNFETVLKYFHNSDVWVNAPTATLHELAEMDSRHNLFKPMKESRVYSFNARIKERGANDFWESAVAHPDRIVTDMIWALHPDLQPNYTPYYIQKLQ